MKKSFLLSIFFLLTYPLFSQVIITDHIKVKNSKGNFLSEEIHYSNALVLDKGCKWIGEALYRQKPLGSEYIQWRSEKDDHLISIRWEFTNLKLKEFCEECQDHLLIKNIDIRIKTKGCNLKYKGVVRDYSTSFYKYYVVTYKNEKGMETTFIINLTKIVE